MNTIQCDFCHETVPVFLYFHDEEIIVQNSKTINNGNEKYYEAVVHGDAICPACGWANSKRFSKSISKSDIIDLAGGRGE